MAENWKGVHDPDNIQEGYFTGLMNSCGYRIKDLRKPIIGIANSYTDVNPGHRSFGELVKFVKEGIWSAGGVPGSLMSPPPATAWPRAQGCIISCPSVI